MSSGMKLDPDSARSSHEMIHFFGQRGISKSQQAGVSARENGPFPCSRETSPFQHKNKSKHSLGQPYLAPNRELRQAANNGQVAQPQFSENDQRFGHKSGDGDELVKHMSNLPGFLQRVEKEKTIQEKALNFGVLDWKLLGKWKYTERMPGRSPKKTSSTSGPPKIGPSLKKHPYSHVCHPTLHSGKQSLPSGSHFNSPQRQPPSPHISHLKDVRYPSYHREEKCVGPIKSKGSETSKQKFEVAQVDTSSRQQDYFHQRVQHSERICSKPKVDNRKRKDPRIEDSSPEQSKDKFSPLPPINAQGKRNEMKSDGERKSNTECCLSEPRNIVSLPRHLPKNGYTEGSQFMKSRTSLDGQLLGGAGRLSDFISADARHSSPLPSAATFYAEHTMEPHDMATSRAINLSLRTNTCSSANSATATVSEGNCSMTPKEKTRASAVTEASNKTHADITEPPIVRGRAPSPTRRLSFSLGKLSRSGSFKESSAVPQSSSRHSNVKSGQVRPEVSSGLDNFERDKESANSRGQSSPLRRLLNPLLKYKGAQSAETALPSNGSLHTMTPKTTSAKAKPEASFIQALLQLSLKNEIPFFKLVVDNSEDLLAAAVKRVPTSGKCEPCMIYTFYSVHELRKKGLNWISQGSKSKSCNLGYKIVGQMKISNSYHWKVKAADYGACDDAKECILYGVDPGQVDKQTLEFVPNKEIAAIIVNNLIKKPKAELSSTDQLYKETKFPQSVSAATFEMEENKLCNSVVAIFPGGVHGTPIKGGPSSLISRWRSGGQCDCGGWDVGCKLRILADRKRGSNVIQASVSSSSVDRVNLFVQGDELKRRPAFNLEPLRNGLYNVELDPSISLLEAFATCVAYITCSKFPGNMDMKGQLNAGYSPEAIGQTDTTRMPITFKDQLPAKFIACPPLSPAGRI